MNKPCYMDYAIAAFRFYAREGSSKREKIRAQDSLKCKIEGSNILSAADMHKDQKLIRMITAEICDIEAVERAVDTLKQMPGGDQIIASVNAVYMLEPEKSITDKVIFRRIRDASLSIPAEKQSIHTWLNTAAEVFAQQRGMSIR